MFRTERIFSSWCFRMFRDSGNKECCSMSDETQSPFHFSGDPWRVSQRRERNHERFWMTHDSWWLMTGLVNLCWGRGEFRDLLLHALHVGDMLLEAIRFQGVSRRWWTSSSVYFSGSSLDSLADVGTDMSSCGLRTFEGLKGSEWETLCSVTVIDCEEVFLRLSDYGPQWQWWPYVARCGNGASRPRSAPFPHAHDISDISHALPRTSVSPKLPAVMSPAAARPDKTRQIDCETKQAPVAVMFSKVRGPDESWGPSLFEGLFGWYRNRWKQNLDADAKLSRTRAGEIQTGYCSCSGIVGGGTDKLMCLIVQASSRDLSIHDSWCVCVCSQEYWWWWWWSV